MELLGVAGERGELWCLGGETDTSNSCRTGPVHCSGCVADGPSRDSEYHRRAKRAYLVVLIARSSCCTSVANLKYHNVLCNSKYTATGILLWLLHAPVTVVFTHRKCIA